MAASSKTEVKYLTLINVDVPIGLHKPSAPRVLLGTVAGGGNKAIENMFSYISIGSGSSDRVGRKIFVKSITFKYTLRYCPSTTAVAAGWSNSPTQSMRVRMMVTDTRNGFAVDDNLWTFDAASTANYDVHLKYPDRTVYNVFYDKMYTSSPVGSSASVSYLFPSIYINKTLRVNKLIEYQNNATGPKNENTVYSLAFIASNPSITDATYPQLIPQYYCATGSTRIYYTDA